MTSSEIRSQFLRFFEERGHKIVRSSPLVPANDPTLLFTNAGMNQFKDVFLGREKRDYLRACSSQKCVRAGGKHNDLEQVGRTRRHHTFFEMLGNFSFGDYFKEQAIPWAWELITEVYKIPAEKLYVTIFEGSAQPQIPRDDEAHGIWLSTGVPAERIFELGMKENFWQMGETGPCGPCSEIHYDMGPAASDLGHADCKFPCDCGRYVEIWNLVFMQFNRDEQGTMTPLPRPSIDTGAGLERLAAVLQGKLSNFDTDLFKPLIEEAADLAHVEYGANSETDVSLRIIADHSRAATFLISDGVLPSNEGRGYVLRLIMRRALYHGQTLGLSDPFLYKMSGRVVDLMKDAYPELAASAPHVAKAIKIEEERYANTTRVGVQKLNEIIGKDRGVVKVPGGGFVVSGEDLFRLHDTFGLRPDFVEDIVRTRGGKVDRAGYEAEMQKQRERARASWKGAEKRAVAPIYEWLAEKHKTAFDGYSKTSLDARIVAIVKDGESVETAGPGEEVEIILDRTPFFPGGGGQEADAGRLTVLGDPAAIVLGVYQPVPGTTVHRTLLRRDHLGVKRLVTAEVDVEHRDAIRRNHTATHLLHAALREWLGSHVKQAGSLVAADRLRFDFTHYAPLQDSDVIEHLVNQHILANEPVATDSMSLDQALNSGAMALFGEKYGKIVRVVSVGDGSFSKELCGGTHVKRTGDIGLFKILSESSVSAGVRRIEAITGTAVLEHLRHGDEALAQLRELLHAKPGETVAAAEKLVQEEKSLRKQLEAQRLKRAAASAGDLVESAREVKGVRVIAAKLDALDRPALRQMVDQLRPKLGSGVIVLGSATDGSAALVAAVSKDLTSKLDAGKIVRAAAAIAGGSGGGRKDLAEAGAKNPEKLQESLDAVPGIVESML